MFDDNPSKAMDLCVPYAGGSGAKSESISSSHPKSTTPLSLSAHRESGSGGALSASSTSFWSSPSKSSQPKRDKKRSANALIDLTHSDEEDEEAPVASAYRGGGGSSATGGGKKRVGIGDRRGLDPSLLGLSAASEPSKPLVFKYPLVPHISTRERERSKENVLLNALMVSTLDYNAKLTIKTDIDAMVKKHPGRAIKIGSSFAREVTNRTSSSLAVVFPVLFSNDSAGANAEGYGIAYAKERGICVNVRQEKEGSFGRNEKRGAAGDAGWSESDPGCLYIAMTRYLTSKDYHDNYLSYHYSCADYVPEDLDNNGRKIHINSVTGEAGANQPTYKDGRKEHTNSVTGEAGANQPTYEDGRKLSSRHYNEETIASMSLSAPAKMPSHRAKSGSGRAIAKTRTKEEDDALLDGVKLHGVGKWAQIRADNLTVLKDRGTMSISHRYNTISGKVAGDRKAETAALQRDTTATGRVKLKRWTDDEKDAVREGVREFGMKWT